MKNQQLKQTTTGSNEDAQIAQKATCVVHLLIVDGEVQYTCADADVTVIVHNQDKMRAGNWTKEQSEIMFNIATQNCKQVPMVEAHKPLHREDETVVAREQLLALKCMHAELQGFCQRGEAAKKESP
jgi:hypothetical protein